MTVTNFVKFKSLDFDVEDRRFFGEILSSVSGYLRQPKAHLMEGNTKVRDWPEKLLEEMLPLLKVLKSRRRPKVVVIRRKK